MRDLSRRGVIGLVGGAAAWPVATRAQQRTMPVDSRAPDSITDFLRAFRQGLTETGHVEGENMAIEYRWAGNHVDRLPGLATDLARRRVAVIVAGSSPAVIAAKTATATIPIVFFAPEDPVRLGLVTTLSRPGGNLTGVNVFVSELAAKRLARAAKGVDALGYSRRHTPENPADAANAASNLRDVETAARAMGLQIQVFNADSSREIDAAFETLLRRPVDALFVSSSPFFEC
jgi:putative tryptophan/tyrosine transport system substrate-binding protein